MSAVEEEGSVSQRAEGSLSPPNAHEAERELVSIVLKLKLNRPWTLFIKSELWKIGSMEPRSTTPFEEGTQTRRLKAESMGLTSPLAVRGGEPISARDPDRVGGVGAWPWRPKPLMKDWVLDMRKNHSVSVTSSSLIDYWICFSFIGISCNIVG